MVGLAQIDPLPPEQARQRAEEILAQPEYQPPSETIVDRVQEYIGDRIGSLFSTLLSGGLGSLFTGALLIGLGLVVWLVVRNLRGAGFRVSRAAVPGVESRVESRRRAAEWKAMAAEHAAAGRWRDALRCHHRAMTTQLGILGRIDDGPGSTAGEVESDIVRGAPELTAPASELTDAFDTAWYSDAVVGPDDVADFERRGDELVDGWPKR